MGIVGIALLVFMLRPLVSDTGTEMRKKFQHSNEKFPWWKKVYWGWYPDLIAVACLVAFCCGVIYLAGHVLYFFGTFIMFVLGYV